jgi:acyl-CoA dehydrogenase
MELLALAGDETQRRRWLEPLLAGEIRSAFAMTEPAVASSDPRGLETRIELTADTAVVSGRKWWVTGLADPRCAVMIVLGVSDADAAPYERHSMVLVPLDTPGVEVVRSLPVFGYHDQAGHGEVVFHDVAVPSTHLLGPRGQGFRLAQERLGPGRVHHCMRALGTAERALEIACRRALSRRAFGARLADHGVVADQIARCRLELDQARLLVLHTAWLLDTVGARAARSQVAAIKAVVPSVACTVVDRAIQIHGGAGVSDDTPLAAWYAALRTLRIADGPDEVHLRTVARAELRRHEHDA